MLVQHPAGDVETRFDTSNYEIDIPLLIGKNNNVIGLMKDGLGERVMKEFIALRPKIYRYLTYGGSIDNKANDTKKCVIKYEIKFENYKFCMEENKQKPKNQQRFSSGAHNIFIKKS